MIQRSLTGKKGLETRFCMENIQPFRSSTDFSTQQGVPTKVIPTKVDIPRGCRSKLLPKDYVVEHGHRKFWRTRPLSESGAETDPALDPVSPGELSSFPEAFWPLMCLWKARSRRLHQYWASTMCSVRQLIRPLQGWPNRAFASFFLWCCHLSKKTHTYRMHHRKRTWN